MMKVGVLALQGDFAEHIAALRPLGVETFKIVQLLRQSYLDRLHS